MNSTEKERSMKHGADRPTLAVQVRPGSDMHESVEAAVGVDDLGLRS